jgi:hypothetical protein
MAPKFMITGQEQAGHYSPEDKWSAQEERHAAHMLKFLTQKHKPFGTA